MNERVVDMRGIGKTFPGVRALDGVDFHLERGEIHALLGENGAGKSTLIKVMTGMYRPDAGEMFLDGRRVVPRSVVQMQSAGISTIYQEINLIPHMSACQNIVLGREKTGRLGLFIDWHEARKLARSLLSRLGLDDIDVDRPLNSHSTAVQQMVAIARALSFDSKVVVMDEPTSSLNEGEIASLFALIRSLRDEGVTFLFVSHKLKEVFELCDAATVLRDGRLVGRRPVRELDQYALVSMMIGRDASSVLTRRKEFGRADGGRMLCSLEGVACGTKVRGLEFSISEGEILGLAGLLGSGRTETLEMLFGARAPDSGVIRVDGEECRLAVPRDAINRHFAFCPEDRKADGIFPNMSVMDNMAITSIGGLSRRGVVSHIRKLALARDCIDRLGIKASSPNQTIGTMSGGNQQKAVLARWLATRPRLLLLDEPTRGIDVGARKEILDMIRSFAAEGLAVLMVSSEWDELLQVCDRILVYRDGRNVRSLSGRDMTEEAIISSIAGEGR